MDHLERGRPQARRAQTRWCSTKPIACLDMGFYDDIAYVAKQCPAGRQTLLFSATYPEGIAQLARQFMRSPQEIKLLEQHAESKIRQRFYEVKHDERLQAVPILLKHYRPVSTLRFLQHASAVPRPERNAQGAGLPRADAARRPRTA